MERPLEKAMMKFLEDNRSYIFYVISIIVFITVYLFNRDEYLLWLETPLRDAKLQDVLGLIIMYVLYNMIFIKDKK